MSILHHVRSLSTSQRRAFIAAFLGWTLDAFDFFILTFCMDALAATFHVSREAVTISLFWTLAMRPLGAFLFGWLAERIGRRPTLMLNIVCFSVLELCSAFAPTFALFLAARALFGIAMGGEWGVGAAIALETLPVEGRGFFSGLLQEGYVTGYLLAATVYGMFATVVASAHVTGFAASWRMLFVIGALPALLAIYVRSRVEESPAWINARAARASGTRTVERSAGTLKHIAAHFPRFLFLAVLMFAFTSFSHGTQDLYASFLKHDHGLSKGATSLVAIIGSIGALLGGMVCGTLSERFGRRRVIAFAALLAIPVIPLWAWSHTAAMLAVGGFLMQFMVQGAWGVVPVHLNELAPAPVRAIFPGLAYQLGNLLSSGNGWIQSSLSHRYFNDQLAPVLALTVLFVAIFVALAASLGREAKGADLSAIGSA